MISIVIDSSLKRTLIMSSPFFVIFLKNIQNLICKKAGNDSLGGGDPVPPSPPFHKKQNVRYIIGKLSKFYTRYINFDSVSVWGILIFGKCAQPLYDSWTLLTFVRRKTHSCVTRLTPEWRDSCICDMTHSFIHASCRHLRDVTWLIRRWQDSCICKIAPSHVTWLMYLWHDSLLSDMTHV